MNGDRRTFLGTNGFADPPLPYGFSAAHAPTPRYTGRGLTAVSTGLVSYHRRTQAIRHSTLR